MMKLLSEFINKLILKKGFFYYPEDRYLIIEILKFSEKKNSKVLDIGCGIGHYSFLFEKYGANVVAFDYNKDLIESANEKKKEIKSSIKFMNIDGNYPEQYFSEKFDIIFMSGFALFGIYLDEKIMKKYLLLLDDGGKLIFVTNSNLTGLVRKTNWKNYTIKELIDFFEGLDLNIEKIYSYDRHIIIKILRSFVFSSVSTKFHLLIIKLTKLPCNMVFIFSRKGGVL